MDTITYQEWLTMQPTTTYTDTHKEMTQLQRHYDEHLKELPTVDNPISTEEFTTQAEELF